jgi:hypothetical protein
MGETKFQALGDRFVASELLINTDVENDLLFFSLNHGILKAKESHIGMRFAILIT